MKTNRKRRERMISYLKLGCLVVKEPKPAGSRQFILTQTHQLWTRNASKQTVIEQKRILPLLRSVLFASIPADLWTLLGFSARSRSLCPCAQLTEETRAVGVWAGISSAAASHTGLTSLPCWCHSRGGLCPADPRLNERHSTLHKFAPASSPSY